MINMEVERALFKRFMYFCLRIWMVICCIASFISVVMIIYCDRFIDIEDIITIVIATYIIYIILSCIDLLLLWLHRDNPVSMDLIEIRKDSPFNKFIKKKDNKIEEQTHDRTGNKINGD